MASEAITKKKKKYSKNTKRNWRKHTDVKDVEDYLEEVRREERTGGPVADKPDESLFFVDKKVQDVIDESVPKRSRKRKILKEDQLLLPDTNVKPVGSKKRKNLKNKTKNQNQDDSDLSDDELEKTRKNNLTKPKKTNIKTRETADFDLWASDDKLEGDEYYLSVTRKTKIKAPKTIKRKVTEIPAIEVCAPGASYNPTFEEHQELLQKAHETEVNKVKIIEKLSRQFKYLSKKEAANLPTWEEEMGQGLFDEDKDDSDHSDEEEEEDEVKPAKSTTRKTKQQRQKEIDGKKQQKQQATEKKLKIKENEVFRIKSIKKEIQLKETKSKEKQKKKDEFKKDELKRSKRLGKHSFEEASVEIKLSDEISGNLRSMKPEGNLFDDRFKSLQKRNLIEPRKRVMPHRRYALKEYDKKSYKKPCIKEF